MKKAYLLINYLSENFAIELKKIKILQLAYFMQTV